MIAPMSSKPEPPNQQETTLPSTTKTPFFINGPAGQLQAELLRPEASDGSSVALVLHPHPLFQGTMDNKVVTTVCRAFTDLNIATLRFNFRGVGSSEGQHDNGQGEQEDAATAASWLAAEFPDSKLLLAGFSFGAATAIRVADRTNASKLISCGVPAAYFVDEQPTVSCPWLAIHGEADDVAPWPAAKEWLSARPEQPKIISKAEVGHFFHGELGWLRDEVKAFAG